MTNDADILGIPVNAPTVLMHSIALGGGSIVVLTQASKPIAPGTGKYGCVSRPGLLRSGRDGADTDRCVARTLNGSRLTISWAARASSILNARTKSSNNTSRSPLGKSVEQAALDIASAAFQRVADTWRDSQPG